MSQELLAAWARLEASLKGLPPPPEEEPEEEPPGIEMPDEEEIEAEALRQLQLERRLAALHRKLLMAGPRGGGTSYTDFDDGFDEGFS